MIRNHCDYKLIKLYRFFLDNPGKEFGVNEILANVGRDTLYQKRLGTLFKLGLIEIYKTPSRAVRRYKLLR